MFRILYQIVMQSLASPRIAGCNQHADNTQHLTLRVSRMKGVAPKKYLPALVLTNRAYYPHSLVKSTANRLSLVSLVFDPPALVGQANYNDPSLGRS